MSLDTIKQQAVLITGASQGIGAACAQQISQEGFTTILVSRNKEKLEQISQKLPTKSHSLSCDLTDPTSLNDLIKEVSQLLENQNLKLQSLINNAGAYENKAFLETSFQSTLKLFQLNVFAPMNLTHALIPHLKLCPNSSLINISSTLGNRPVANTSIYSATKSALKTWSQTLALELAPNIRCNTISPGIIDTPIHDFHKSPQKTAILQEIDKLQPMGTIGTPNDVASFVTFLISEKASWITGADFVVDGGISLN